MTHSTTNLVRGHGGGKESNPRSPIEAPDSLRSNAYAKIIDIISEGEIYGFANQANPLACIFFNETPVANADGSLNFKNVHIDSRVGTQTQDPYDGFDATENEIAVGADLRDDLPWTRSFTNLDLTAVRIRLQTTGLSKQDPSTGDLNGYSVSYRFELSVDGGSYVTILNSAMTGKTSSTYERSYRFELPPATTSWTFKVTRLTPNSELSTIRDGTRIESFTELIAARLRMPMTASVASIIDAEQFRSIPSRAFHMKGRIVKVPTNYDPDTRTYSGVWDGTFQPRYSNNPAWVFYDLVLNDRYGLGGRVPPELLDKWALYNIAVYCDGMVDDGQGGLEPRFTANIYLQTRRDAHRWLQDITSAFRGIMYASSGGVTTVGDMPADPIYTYTAANVIDGKFTYAGSARKVRHTVALVSWNDMTDFCRAKVEYVDDPEGIARYGVQETEVIAIGCTSRGQARRLGKYILATERYETDSVSFAVGLDGTFPAPGKIIEIADPLRAGRRTGGRISAATVNSVTVDMLPVLAIGDTITVVLPTGTTEKRTVNSIVGNVIGVSVNFSAIPVSQSVWMVESSELSAQLYRVIGVAEKDEGISYSITALQHVPGKFDFVENNVPIIEPNISAIDPVVFSPGVIDLSYRVRSDGATLNNVLTADWEPVAGAVRYGVQWRRDSGEWTAPVETASSNIDHTYAFEGNYIVKVWAINSLGAASNATYSPTLYVPPPETAVKQLDIVGGVVEIDCAYSQFELLLTQDCVAEYINVSLTDTILITVIQGSSGIAKFDPGSSVSPINGKPYVTTQVAGARDVLGQNTTDGGLRWDLVYQQPDAATGGVFTVSIAPSPASASVETDGVTPSAPSVVVTGSTTNGAAPFTHAWTRADSGGTNFVVSDPTIAAPAFSIAAATTNYLATQSWRYTATDANGVVASKLVNITLQRTVVGGMTISISPSPAYAICYSGY